MKVKETSPSYIIQKKRYTYQDYLDLPEDGIRYEIINGDLIMTPAPNTLHQDILLRIANEIMQFIKDKNRGKIYISPIDVVLSDDIVVQPDILFIAGENFSIITEKNISGVPDFIIEILSPSTGYYDLVEKKDIYEKFGVKEYWIVDSKKQWVEIYLNEANKFKLIERLEKEGVLKSKLLVGFVIDFNKIFDIK